MANNTLYTSLKSESDRLSKARGKMNATLKLIVNSETIDLGAMTIAERHDLLHFIQVVLNRRVSFLSQFNKPDHDTTQS